MTIAELVAKISLKGGDKAVAQMQGLMKSTIATKAALLGAVAALYKMSDAARQSAMFMDMYQLNTGLSTEQLQKMSYQAAAAGVSMQELGGTIQKLQQMNANARLGYGWDPILTRFGVTPGQDPVTQLNQISNALKRLGASNPAEAHALASKVGLSDSMYYALMKMGTEQMNKQLILTQKEQQALVKLNIQWNKVWFYLKQVTVKIQALGAAFQTRVVKVLTRAIQGFYELFLRIYNTVTASEKLKTEIKAIGVALTAAFAPELLLLSAVALVLEDIFTYFEGGQSVTGRIIEWCKQSEEFKDMWESIGDIFNVFIELIKMAYTGWKELIAALKDAGFFEEMMKGICESIRFFVDAIMNLLALPPVRWALKRAGFEGISDIADKRLAQDADFMDSAISKWWSSFLNPFSAMKETFGIGTQNNNTNIYVQGSGDPRAVAQYVGEMQQSVAQANAQQHVVAQGGAKGNYRAGRMVPATSNP